MGRSLRPTGALSLESPMPNSESFSPQYRIPIGTQVVLRRDHSGQRTVSASTSEDVVKKAGSVGVVQNQPLTHEYSYRVEFADGVTVAARFEHLAVHRLHAPDAEVAEREVDAYRGRLILRVAMGSHAYGLATENSDLDEKGIYLPPADWHWSLHPLPEQLEFKQKPTGEIVNSNQAIESDDFCWWELEKFLRLAIRANPTALEVLFAPERSRLHVTEWGERLLAIREAFLSTHIYQTYSGYALSQFRRMERRRQNKKPHKPKHAMHLIRLLISGASALRTGTISVEVGEHRDELLAMKSGTVSFESVHERALELDREFRAAVDASRLPERPNVEVIDQFLRDARRSAT